MFTISSQIHTNKLINPLIKTAQVPNHIPFSTQDIRTKNFRQKSVKGGKPENLREIEKNLAL